MELRFKPIGSDKKIFDPVRWTNNIKLVMDQAETITSHFFELSCNTFDHSVSFNVTRVDAYSRDVFTTDKVYFYLNAGTSVRYALMSKDFEAKTAPGQLRPGNGQGGVILIDRNHPRPGIKARKFDEQIKKLVADEIKKLAGNYLTVS